ncbi:MAG TPA: hypothetical protein VGR57_04555, partial [Ktedonobacterales bacterium]|nr:hypothetical protein [Ktedonobacterales bacterium]
DSPAPTTALTAQADPTTLPHQVLPPMAQMAQMAQGPWTPGTTPTSNALPATPDPVDRLTFQPLVILHISDAYLRQPNLLN